MDDLEWMPPGPGPWMQDRAHLPASVTAMLQATYPASFEQGFREAMAEYGALIDTLRMEFVNGFPYHQLVPFDAPGPDGPRSEEYLGAEIGRRTGVAAAAFEQRLWRETLRSWDDDVKPAAVRKHRALGSVDLGSLTTEELRAHLHACVEHARAMAYQHHRYNAAALVPVGDFVLHAARWTGRDPVPLFVVFDGWSPVSSVMPPEMEPVVAAVHATPGAPELLDGEAAAADRLAELIALVPAVQDYLDEVGFRIAAGFDITNPTARERPDLVLGRIRAALDYDATHSKDRSEALANELRASVPPDDREEFDRLLGEARGVYRLRDERGIYSDASATGLLRLALIELGTRLAAEGRIAFLYDTLDLRPEEIDAILDGAEHPTAAELTDRVARRKATSAAGAPALLGPPPPPPPPVDLLPPPLARVMSALGFVIEGVRGSAAAPAGDVNVVVGIAGSGGVYEGTARLVRNFDELLELQDGDVLVTTATGESFNSFLHMVGAIVTDYGSFASHAAIMGREMGFPTVVGTVDGTSRIPNGARVRVDGSAGVVVLEA